jgi:hypothetical protein
MSLPYGRAFLGHMPNRTSIATSGPLQKWVRALLEADAALLSALMLEARRRSGSWSLVAEEIAAALSEVGTLWGLGSCKIFEEHAASEALRRAAASCSGQIALKCKVPSALLLTVAGYRHRFPLRTYYS